ncbi:hypothetical protein ACFQZO_10555 [Bradyrhizobium sp. GCM10027634]|uniref:hypothetical protein n=1 Tax=unclassified Bradyrhizobium TaxID=2631580 RepID=UPI00188D7074|nr:MULTISPECIES: hypothetical protein [unclassified Bradyrhizobium]MDN5001324.1 hypothetical protein [Bradyrhizobium sp. WYCCWR 12677]
MTNEAIKALMVFAMFGILELALYFSPADRPARQPIRSGADRTSNPDLAGERLED